MPTVVVLGAGTMGSGIAQVAALSGWDAVLYDVRPEFVRSQMDRLRATLDKLVERGKLSAAERDSAIARVRAGARPADAAGANLLIEAVVEDMAAKVSAITPFIGVLDPSAPIASNTSSLSITRLASELHCEERVVGMHFFNPVPLMPLVEVISAPGSAAAAVERTAEAARAWGKTVVRAKDTPGFIVNRVARGYYLESLRMLDEGVAGVDEIDRALKRLGGFRMGPFELMDLIGIDVNYSVSCSVWEQMERPARLTPHHIQQELAAAGHLGRKCGRGFYLYDADTPVPAVAVQRRSFQYPPELREAVRRVVVPGVAQGAEGSATEECVFARVLVTIINEAALALDAGVAAKNDIDVAMRLGTNYPHGPLEWAERIGRRTCAALLRVMDRISGDGRFAPAGWLTA
ncbi:MAG: 3-hydroxybutyryl-CoA dehydrogenase [Phycisphaerales bacterium]|nr:3-hydroxybutyryl-CoA dehydrogenase [Phycisphaerales bacterium]